MDKGVNYELNTVKAMSGLKFLHINIRSLLHKLPLVTHDYLDDKFDVVLISESWLQRGIPDNIVMVPEYNFVRKDRSTQKRGGGLCIYLKQNIIYTKN